MKRLLVLLLLLAVPANAGVRRFVWEHTENGFPALAPPQYFICDTEAEKPTGNLRAADIAFTLDTDKIWKWDGSAWIEVGAAGGSAHTIQDEGVSLTARALLDFAGAGVTCTDSAGTTTLCTIPGGGGGTPTGTGYRHVTAGVEDAASVAPIPIGDGGTTEIASTEDAVLVGASTTDWVPKVLPACIDTAGNHLNYDQATNTFSCGTTHSSAASGWTDDGATIRLTTITDNVGIGTTSPYDRLEVVDKTAWSVGINLRSSIAALDGNDYSAGRILAGFDGEPGYAASWLKLQNSFNDDAWTTGLKLKAGVVTLTYPLEVPSGGTGSVPAGDDQLLVSDSAAAATWRTLTICTGAGKAITYDTATNTFGCNTIAGGSTPTGTGFRHVVAGVEDAAAKLVDTADINDNQVTFAKLDDLAPGAGGVLIGRKTAGTGNPEAIDVNSTDFNITALQLNLSTVSVIKGGTGAAPGADDQLLVSDSGVAATWRLLTVCTGAGKALTYDTATNTFGCNTIAGGSAPTGYGFYHTTAGVMDAASWGGGTDGDTIFWNASGIPSDWILLPIGNPGDVYTIDGSNHPSWVAPTVYAPASAEYIVAEAHADLTAEVAPTATGEVPVSSSATAAAWTNMASAGTGRHVVLASPIEVAVNATYVTIFTVTPILSKTNSLRFTMHHTASATTVGVQFRVRSADAGNVGFCGFSHFGINATVSSNIAVFTAQIAIAAAPADSTPLAAFSTAFNVVKIDCEFVSDASPGDVILEAQLETGTTSINVLGGSSYIYATN